MTGKKSRKDRLIIHENVVTNFITPLVNEMWMNNSSTSEIEGKRNGQSNIENKTNLTILKMERNFTYF